MELSNLEIAKRLKKVLHDLDLSQKEFAQRAGLSEAVISKIKNGKGGETPHVIQSISDAFPDIDIKWLFGSEIIGQYPSVFEEPATDYIRISKDTVIDDLRKQLEQKDMIINRLLGGGSTQTGASAV